MNASTQAEMWAKFKSGAMSMVPLVLLLSMAQASIGAPIELLSLSTRPGMSAVSGYGLASGGLNGASTSPQRVVTT